MVRVGIGVVAMALVVAMRMGVIMGVVMGVGMGVLGMVVTGPDAFDVMVVAFLRQADFGLEAQHLIAVFAHLTVHQICAV
jgi:hypothetical protein